MKLLGILIFSIICSNLKAQSVLTILDIEKSIADLAAFRKIMLENELQFVNPRFSHTFEIWEYPLSNEESQVSTNQGRLMSELIIGKMRIIRDENRTITDTMRISLIIGIKRDLMPLYIEKLDKEIKLTYNITRVEETLINNNTNTNQRKYFSLSRSRKGSSLQVEIDNLDREIYKIYIYQGKYVKDSHR